MLSHWSTDSALLCNQEYSEAEASSAMKRMLQHHAANGWGDDTAQPAVIPAPADDSQAATADSGVLKVKHAAAHAGHQRRAPEDQSCALCSQPPR